MSSSILYIFSNEKCLDTETGKKKKMQFDLCEKI